MGPFRERARAWQNPSEEQWPILLIFSRVLRIGSIERRVGSPRPIHSSARLRPFLYSHASTNQAASMVKWRWVRSSISIRRGGHHVRPTQSRSATVALGRRGLRAADGQALAHSDVRGHSRHWTPYDLQSAPRHPRAGSRPSLQLSPRLLAAPLVVVALGPRLGRSHPAPLGPRGLRRAGRR